MKQRKVLSTIGQKVTVDLAPGQVGILLVTVVDSATGQLVNNAVTVSTMERQDDRDGISDALALIGLTNALALARAHKAN